MRNEPARAASYDGPATATIQRPEGRARVAGLSGVVDVLEVDGELAAAAARSNANGQASLPAATLELPRGPWKAPSRAEPTALGLLVLSGLLIRRVACGRAACNELLGPGDLLRPWLEDGDGLITPSVDWEVYRPARLALLNGEASRVCAAHPALMTELLDRTLARSRRQGILNAIAITNRIEERVLLLFGQLADRWGRVTPDGVLITLPLTHAVISELVGARRPTVTTAISELRQAGAVERRPEGWLLTETGRGRLNDLTQPAAR